MDAANPWPGFSACKTRGVWGHAPPGNLQKLDALRLLLRDRRVSRSSYMAHRVLHPIFSCPCMHLLSQLTSNREKVLRLAEQKVR